MTALARDSAQPEETRRRGHLDVIRANTGWKLDPHAWVERWKASAILAQQSEAIADALGRMGVDVRAESEVTMIGAVTGQVAELTAYKAVRFIPAVAARDRRPILNGMRFFIEEHPSSKYFRYVVMTSAEPVPAGGPLRKTIAALNRRISKWAVEAREHGVEVLFRGIEYTRATAAERKMEDRFPPETILYHVHANVLTWPQRAMKEEAWRKFLTMTWRAVKAHWRDNGRVKDCAELVKYVLKPGDLKEASDHEILWLYEQSRRLKICQPMGPFAAFMREMEEAGEKVVRMRRHGQTSELVRVAKGERLDHSKREPREETSTSGSPPNNILLGVSLPQWRWTPWAEPMLLVQRYVRNPIRKSDEDRLAEIHLERAAARADWDASGAPSPEAALAVADLYGDGKVTAMPSRAGAAGADPYRVHTCRPTVRSEAEGGGPTCVSPPPDPSNVVSFPGSGGTTRPDQAPEAPEIRSGSLRDRAMQAARRP